ncbi:hypothetical protein PHLCEN_2v5357 [Hermanssonia centrifuga]|uniref:Uncharacterized protein n=1 Tax=Hermanssonia centrifuga TaxID=98765 RepID=A0A2R6P5E6_9APHY|nr:hypothetical protein PHLCEN_2v5357 [Hermanssonia centrifuga]
MLQSGGHGGQSLASDIGAPSAPLLDRLDYPDIDHWREDDWDNRNTKGVTYLHEKPSQSTAGKCSFVQKADGGGLDPAEWKALNSTTRGLFNGLQPVPDSWMADSTMKQRLAVYDELIFRFPFLGFCNGYWKAEKYVINQYPLWKAARKWKLEASEEGLLANVTAPRKRPSKDTNGLCKKKSKVTVTMDIPNPLLGMAPPVLDLLLTGATAPSATASMPSEDTVAASTRLDTAISQGCEGIAATAGACASDPGTTSESPAPATPPEEILSGPAVVTNEAGSGLDATLIRPTTADLPITDKSTTPTVTVDEVPTKRRGRIFQPGPKHTAR